MAKPGQPIPPKTKERVAELIGLGLTMEEAGHAKDISRMSVDRIMSKPEYRKIADDIQRQRTSMKAEVASVLRAALTAVDSDGNPLFSARQQAAMLYAKNPEFFDLEDAEGEDDGMLPGVTLVFAYAEDEPLSGGGDEGEEGASVQSAGVAPAESGEEREDLTLVPKQEDDLFSADDLAPVDDE